MREHDRAEMFKASGLSELAVDTADRSSTALDMMPIINLVSSPYGQNPKATNLLIFHLRALHLRNALFLFRCLFLHIKTDYPK